LKVAKIYKVFIFKETVMKRKKYYLMPLFCFFFLQHGGCKNVSEPQDYTLYTHDSSITIEQPPTIENNALSIEALSADFCTVFLDCYFEQKTPADIATCTQTTSSYTERIRSNDVDCYNARIEWMYCISRLSCEELDENQQARTLDYPCFEADEKVIQTCHDTWDNTYDNNKAEADDASIARGLCLLQEQCSDEDFYGYYNSAEECTGEILETTQWSKTISNDCYIAIKSLINCMSNLSCAQLDSYYYIATPDYPCAYYEQSIDQACFGDGYDYWDDGDYWDDEELLDDWDDDVYWDDGDLMNDYEWLYDMLDELGLSDLINYIDWQ
jgi:hypothetical protein